MKMLKTFSHRREDERRTNQVQRSMHNRLGDSYFIHHTVLRSMARRLQGRNRNTMKLLIRVNAFFFFFIRRVSR